MPLDLAIVRVDADAAGCIEVVALGTFRIARGAQPRVPRCRVARTEDQRVGLGVIGTAQPGGAAAGFPQIARPGRVQRAGHRGFFAVQGAHVAFDDRAFPDHLAGFGIACLNRADDPELTARVAGDDQTFDDQRSRRVAVACLVVGDLFAPNDLAGVLVQRDDARIQRAEVDIVAIDRGTAVDHVTAGQNTFRQTGIVLPDLFAGLQVDRVEARI